MLRRSLIAACFVLCVPGSVLAAGTEPEVVTPPPVVAPAIACTEADKTKCPVPVAAPECKEADKTKCPPAAAPAATAPVVEECKEADKTKCPQKQGFLERYHDAVALIEAKRYDEAMVAMKALDDGTSADVINYIGYINRKMGKMAEAQMYYEAALHMVPNHRGALEYYGEWYVMMHNLPKAHEHLSRIAALYGTNTKEYRALEEMIQKAEG